MAKIDPTEEPTLQTIIDNGNRMRLNLYPFGKGKALCCKKVFIYLPENKLTGEQYDGKYSGPIQINAINRYVNNGALSGREVDAWLRNNSFGRKRGEPIHIFELKFEERDESHYYTLTRYAGKRLPK